jgi:hypothetical protein
MRHKRMHKPAYESIRLEVLQPNGEWHVRNAFLFENAEVMGGDKSRAWLIALASRIMMRWYGYDSDKQLRVTGSPPPYQPTGEYDGKG